MNKKPVAKKQPAPVAKPAEKPAPKRAKKQSTVVASPAPSPPPAPVPVPPTAHVFSTKDFIEVIGSINGAKKHLAMILAQNPLLSALVGAAQACLDTAVATLAK